MNFENSERMPERLRNSKLRIENINIRECNEATISGLKMQAKKVPLLCIISDHIKRDH